MGFEPVTLILIKNYFSEGHSMLLAEWANWRSYTFVFKLTSTKNMIFVCLLVFSVEDMAKCYAAEFWGNIKEECQKYINQNVQYLSYPLLLKQHPSASSFSSVFLTWKFTITQCCIDKHSASKLADINALQSNIE